MRGAAGFSGGVACAYKMGVRLLPGGLGMIQKSEHEQDKGEIG